MMGLVGGIDAGGTTFKCGIQNDAGAWIARTRVPTTRPEETVAACVDVFQTFAPAMEALGVASFGPLIVDPTSSNYGSIRLTPKPGWSGFNLRRALAEGLRVPVSVDTDVNAALRAELHQGAAQSAATAAYITVGTGIGAGMVSSGHWLGRPDHPEFGHIPVKRHPADLGFRGVCPFHGDCLEGLASVTALKARWGDPVSWEESHPGWDIAADYLAQACLSLCLTLRPQRIILGGGLMLSSHMLPRVQTQFDSVMNKYLGTITPKGRELIVTPANGDDAGLCGAILLARER